MAEPNRTVLTESDITDPGPLKTALDSAGGSGAVSSVNGSTGDVVLSAPDVEAAPLYPGSTTAAMPVESGTYTGHVDEQTLPGVYRVSGSSMSEANGYPPTPDNTGTLVVQSSHSRAYLVQTVYSNKNEAIWTRSLVAGTWYPWKRLDPGAVTPADIGAQPALSGSIPYVNQSGQRTSAPYTSQSFPAMFTFTLSDQSIGLERAYGKVNGLLVRSGIQTLTNPTTIPTDGPERLDLVFTEPTTVSFEQPFVHANPNISSSQAPGVTDLVLSIEGYEHVTWSGVVIHGTPDQSGVVWASALWRQRDSSWHLLCEQDASKFGGGVTLTKHEFPIWKYAPMTDAEGGFIFDTYGRVQHEAGPHPLQDANGNGFIHLATSMANGDTPVIVDTSYVPDSNYSSMTSFSMMQAGITQALTGLGSGPANGFMFFPTEVLPTAQGLKVHVILVLSPDPLAGLSSPNTSLPSMPVEFVPSVAFFDTGRPTNHEYGEGIIPLPGGARFGFRFNNATASHPGVTCEFHDLTGNPIPEPTEGQYLAYGFHEIRYSAILPYDYFSMTGPKP